MFSGPGGGCSYHTTYTTYKFNSTSSTISPRYTTMSGDKLSQITPNNSNMNTNLIDAHGHIQRDHEIPFWDNWEMKMLYVFVKTGTN